MKDSTFAMVLSGLGVVVLITAIALRVPVLLLVGSAFMVAAVIYTAKAIEQKE